MTTPADVERLRTFWEARYQTFGISESGWIGAGDRLNEFLYACKEQALRGALSQLGLTSRTPFSILDAGCGQGFFANFYRMRFPVARYAGLDLSTRVVAHVRRLNPDAEFLIGDISTWDADGRTFDIVQSIDVLHLILEDQLVRRAMTNLARAAGVGGAIIVTAARPDATVQSGGYLRYRSRHFWDELLRELDLEVVDERPMYYWLPNGGPDNRYARYVLARCGAGALYALDRAALLLRMPRRRHESMDCRMKLLTIKRRISGRP